MSSLFDVASIASQDGIRGECIPSCCLWLLPSMIFILLLSQNPFLQVRSFNGFRYKCQRCINYQLCQSCFWRGRVSQSHMNEHEMKEYSSYVCLFIYFISISIDRITLQPGDIPLMITVLTVMCCFCFNATIFPFPNPWIRINKAFFHSPFLFPEITD
jgi:hypothetical protein